MSDTAARPIADQEWEDLMRQLRTLPPAQPRPFFYHRVRTRLTTEANRPWLPAWVRRPAYAMLIGVLVLALNGDGTLATGYAPVSVDLPAPR